MKIKMFCQACNGQAQQPGTSIKVARFVAVPAIGAVGDQPAVPSPNAALFAGQGNATLDLANLAKPVWQELGEGKVYVVTITEAGPTD